VYIGKEANKIEIQELEGNRIETYIDFKKFHQWVLGLETKDAREMGINNRSTLKKIKDKIGQGKKLNYEKGAVKALVENFTLNAPFWQDWRCVTFNNIL
jgi:hypothetical protein